MQELKEAALLALLRLTLAGVAALSRALDLGIGERRAVLARVERLLLGESAGAG